MKRTSVGRLSAVALVALSALTGAHGEELASYGRAGGPVGADRIRYVLESPASLSPDRPQYPGIAGGPVGADRIRHILDTATKSTWTELAAYPGIAGGPVGSDRIAWLFNRQKAKTPTMFAESGLTK